MKIGSERAGYHAMGTSGDAGEARAAIRGVSAMLHRPDSLETTMKPSSHSRREFAKVAGAALAGLAAAPSIAANPRSAQTAPPIATVGGRDPDAIVVNAKVYTMDTRAPRAEAFAVTNGRFTAVGSTGDIKGLAGKSTQTFDAEGHDGRARVHRLPQPRRRRSAAERSAGRQSLRSGVRHASAASSTS